MTQARMEVEQLRREAAIKRIPVSQVVEDIKVSKIVIDITGEKTQFCREGKCENVGFKTDCVYILNRCLANAQKVTLLFLRAPVWRKFSTLDVLSSNSSMYLNRPT